MLDKLDLRLLFDTREIVSSLFVLFILIVYNLFIEKKYLSLTKIKIRLHPDNSLF